MNTLIVRSLSGLVYIALIIVSLYYGWIPMALLICFFAAAGMWEFLKMNRRTTETRIPQTLLDITSCVALTTLPFSFPMMLAVWIITLLARFVMEIYAKEEDPVRNIATSVCGQIYIGLPLATLNAVDYFISDFSGTGPLTLVMTMFIFIWLNDTGAFCVGSLIGRHKLFPRLSPGKSWEGFWGGLAFNIMAAILFSILIPNFAAGMPMGILIGMAVIVTVFATWGDLFESMLKRHAGVKDSGTIMPGHGGILDRIDSLLFVAPATATYFYLLLCTI